MSENKVPVGRDNSWVDGVILTRFHPIRIVIYMEQRLSRIAVLNW